MPIFFYGLKYIPASKATLIQNVHPLIVVVLAYVFLKEKITKTTIIALIGSFIGVVLLSMHETKGQYDTDNYAIGIT